MTGRIIPKAIFIAVAAICLCPAVIGRAQGGAYEGTYFARCNISVLKGNEITWMNFRAAKARIVVNTPIKVRLSADRAIFIDEAVNETYLVDLGSPGEKFLDKLVIKEPVDVSDAKSRYSQEIGSSIISKGMTKEEVYAAMCAPAFIDDDISEGYGYDDILKADRWVYKTSKFGGNIKIEFDKDGLVGSISGPVSPEDAPK